jgi:hypothetical protein
MDRVNALKNNDKPEPYVPKMIDSRSSVKYEPTTIKRKLLDDDSDSDVEEIDDVDDSGSSSQRTSSKKTKLSTSDDRTESDVSEKKSE